MSEWVSDAISSSLLEDWWQQHVWSNLKYLVQCLVRCLVQSKMSTHRNCSYRPILSPRTCAKYDGQLSRARLHLRGVFREHCSPKHATSTPVAVLADNNIKHNVLQSQKNTAIADSGHSFFLVQQAMTDPWHYVLATWTVVFPMPAIVKVAIQRSGVEGFRIGGLECAKQDQSPV